MKPLFRAGLFLLVVLICLVIPTMLPVANAQETGGPSHVLSVDPDGGATYPWEGEVGGTNTGNGNKLTEIPIFSWTARGGMGVEFSLYHNSQGTHNSELGHKWTHSFDQYLVVDEFTGDVIVHHGDDLAYGFIRNMDGTYSAPIGIYDTLVANGNPITSYDLTTKHGIKTRFTSPNGTGFHSYTISDRNGNTITIQRNTSNLVTSVTDPTNRSLSIGYTNGRITSVTDPLSRQFGIQYDANGDLSQINFPAVSGSNFNLQFLYDINHCLTTFRDFRSNNWTFGYNFDNSLAWQKDPLLNQTSFSYAMDQTTITDSNGHTVKHNYSGGRLIGIVDQLNLTESYGYDANGNRTSTVDRRGKTWSRTFDSRGNVLTETTPLNHTVTWTWNSLNLPLTRTNHLSHQQSWTYNAYGNLLTETDALNHTVTHTVIGYGQRISSSDALSHVTQFGFDSNGYPNQVTDANQNVTFATFNALGWKLTETDGLLNVTTYTRDNWGRVTAVSKAAVTVAQTVYDANSNPVQVKDGNLNTTTTVFDAANRITQTTNGRGDIQTYIWDTTGKKGLLHSKSNGNGRTTVYSYTNRNECSSVSYPDGTSESWLYDGNGNVTRHTDGKGQQINRVFDDSGRLITIDFPTGTDTQFVYDAADRRTGMTDSTGTTTWVYDAANRLTSCTTPNGTVSYGYDNANRRTSRTLTGTGTWTFVYDDGNRLTSTTNPYSETTSVQYNAANLPTQVTHGNISVTIYGYDNLLRTVDVWHKTSGGATLGRYQYTLDAASNVTQRSDNDGSVTTFGFDGANQLTSEVRTGVGAYSISYTFDNNGNRLTKTVNGVIENYSYGLNDQLLSAGAKTYQFDNNGNCISVTQNGQTTSLTWDYSNRLTRIDFPGGTFNTFQYNGLGLRTRKVDSAGTFNYVCDGTDPASPVLSDSAAVYTPGESERRSGTSKFYHGDALSSTRGITASNQTATDSILYDAYGMTVSRTGTTPTPFGFVGGAQYQTDTDSGLHLLGHRYYDPGTGRFITQDPIQDGRNWYAYCGSNPVNRYDPTGELFFLIPVGLTATEALIGAGAITVGVGVITWPNREAIAEGIGGAADWIGDRLGEINAVIDRGIDWIVDMAKPHPHRPPGIPWDPSRRPRPVKPDRGGPTTDPRDLRPKEGIPLNPDGTPGTEPYVPPISPTGGNDVTAPDGWSPPIGSFIVRTRLDLLQ